MERKNLEVQGFWMGTRGYLVGAAGATLFIWLVSWAGLPRWFLNLIDQSQMFVRLLAIPVIAGFFLAIGGGILGGVGGWSLTRITKTSHQKRLILGGALAFAVSVSVLLLVFLLLISFIALYNNFSTDRIEHYGIIFGVFGLIFGLVTGVLQAFLTVRLRYTWLVILGSVVGFTLGALLLGILVRFLNPTAGYKTYPILTTIFLLIGLALPFALGGGALGFVYNRIAQRIERSGVPPDFLQPSVWQVLIVAVIGVVITSSVLSTMGQVTNFLVINPANLKSQLTPVTVGVAWSEPQPLNPDQAAELSTLAGQEPAVVTGADDVQHSAWCSAEGVIQYQPGSGPVQTIEYPACITSPSIALDVDGQPHIVWYTRAIRDTNGVERSVSVLVESIFTDKGWSEAAIAAKTDGQVTQALSSDEDGNLVLIWEDTNQEISYAVQEPYSCNPGDLSALERAGLEDIVNKGFRQEGAQIPWCRNRFDRIQYTPNPNPQISNVPVTENGAFDINSALMDLTQYEVLFTTMQYEPNDAPPSPGSVLAQGVNILYQLVKAHPEKYPRGMTVRLMLGNYPETSNFAWGDQIYDLISDIRAAGVEKMVDPDIGWRLEVANYPGTYPHSHTKFIVIDGQTVNGAGYNYGYLHLPKDHPSGRGYDMFDLGLQITGPVAQDAISTFDDMWEGADQIHCEDFHPPDGQDWRDTCRELKATSDHVPEVLRTYLLPDGNAAAFSLYRTAVYKEGDEFIREVLSTAQESVDMMQVNFSLDMICMANLVFPDLCTIDNALPYMKALLQAIEEEGVHVRVIMENTNSNGLENRVAGKVFMQELERLGLADRVELRFYNGKIHAKSTLVDDSLLIIGSQNMHYSSWSNSGLAEYSLATDDPKAVEEYQKVFESKWKDAIPFEQAEYATSP